MAPLASSRMVRWILILSICSKLIGLAEAGMKGKGGRQGHIIIQNEIKDQSQRIVPIYMPIPIPVPMPMGPGGDSTQHHQHHHRQQRQGHGDDEGEVKKIYLLQPMPKIQPQLKGGRQQQHIMGPVQTHIHLPVPMAPPQPASHHQRRPQNFGGGQQQRQNHKQSQWGDGDELVRQQPHKNQLSVPGHSDMKILPIVVIPPIAPMPPIQLQSGAGHHQHQPYESRLHHSANNLQAPSGGRRNHYADNYGGGGGGAVFRDSFANAGGRGRGRRHQHEHRARSQRFQDELSSDDYGDYGPPRPRAAASQQQMRTPRAPPKRRRHSQHYEGRRSAGGRESIRDIINDQQQVTFDDELDDYNGGGEQSASASCCGPSSPEVGSRGQTHTHRPARLVDGPNQSLDSFVSGNDLLEQQQQPPETYARVGARASRLTAQDKGEMAEYANNNHQQGGDLTHKEPTYYEHDALQTDSINQRELTGRRLYSSEREALEDDEWWFDSIKSVAHVASPTSSPSPSPRTSANETTALGHSSSSSSSNANATATVPLRTGQERTRELQL